MLGEQMDEVGVSLHKYFSIMCKHEIDLLYTDPCSRQIEKFKIQDKSMIIVAGSGSEGNSKGSSEFASFSQACGACSDGKTFQRFVFDNF